MSMGADTVQTVKSLLAGLVLLLQLQPALGAAACLGFSERAAQECEMPEHGAVPHSSLMQPGSPVPSCALAAICTPSPLAIPTAADGPESVVALPAEAVITPPIALLGIFSAPPFHPPRA